MRFLFTSLLVVVGLAATGSAAEPTAESPPVKAQRDDRPAMRDFMGLDVHTVQFKPDLYKPVCRLLRDYHPLEWDVGEDTAHRTTFPMAINGVDWSQLYGTWTKAGYDVDACIMFNGLKPNRWKDTAQDARVYGDAFARYFGPSGKHRWVSSAEIGNEPNDFSVPQYRAVFQAMAAGLRAGDPKLKIVTCAMAAGKADPWSKPMAAIDGLQDSYDVLNIHSYAFKDGWPTWRRSFPEDPKIGFLKAIQELIDWRNVHAAGKPIWLTEFGYDSASKPAAKSGPWKDWVGVSDAEQARYIVRSFLVLSAMDLDRAYLYFFNDQDEPQLHGASGITRNFKPKPSFYATSYLDRTLGDYAFVRAASETADLYCFEYRYASSAARGIRPERIYVAWLPIAGEKVVHKVLPISLVSDVHRIERMPMAATGDGPVGWKTGEDGIEVEISEEPIFLFAH